jgi:hypothetical protein
MATDRPNRPSYLVTFLIGALISALGAAAVICLVPLVECPLPYHRMIRHWAPEKLAELKEPVCDVCNSDVRWEYRRVTLLRKWMFEWSPRARTSF